MPYNFRVAIDRRELMVALAATVLPLDSPAAPHGAREMFGMIVKMTAASGQRETLIQILLQATREMPGCFSYVIGEDASNDNDIWITEVWDSKIKHDASLSLPAVRDAIAKAKPIIAAFGTPIITRPVGGHGLPNG